MTEFELFQALRPLYPAAEYALLPQVANGTGFKANRHADALALSLWPSRGLHLSGFEIKSYRGDWLRELANPGKAEEIASRCNYWWIVAANAKIVQDGELPVTWGLLVWDAEKQALKKVKSAPFREAQAPDLAFIAAMLRKAQEVLTPDAVIAEAKRNGYEAGKKDGELSGEIEVERLRALRDRVKEFREASGVDLDVSWQSGQKIGSAVKQVLDGSVAWKTEQLREVAASILEELGAPEKPRARATAAGRRKS